MTDPTPRFTVRLDRIPHEWRRAGAVAWLDDAQRQDGAEREPCMLFADRREAERICAALNRDELFRERLRFTFADVEIAP